MSISELRAGIDLPSEVNSFFDRLLKQKAQTKELGYSPRVACLDKLIVSEMAKTRESLADTKPEFPSDMNVQADALFRKIVKNSTSRR